MDDLLIRMPDNLHLIILGVLYVAGLLAVFWKARQIGKTVDRAKIEENSMPRELTPEERLAGAWFLGHERGVWFWHLLFLGMLLVGLACLAVRVWLAP